jgi:hypothetical protein
MCLLKRKRDSEESHNVQRTPKPPVVGPQPFGIFHLSWSSHQEEIPVKAMFDTGANVITLSTRIADRFNVPRVKRDRPIEIHNFEGIFTAKDAGVYYTFPITFRLHDH